jgi:hypothetical protein
MGDSEGATLHMGELSASPPNPQAPLRKGKEPCVRPRGVNTDRNIYLLSSSLAVFLKQSKPYGLVHPRVGTHATTRERLAEWLRVSILITFIQTLSGYFHLHLDRTVLTTTLYNDMPVFLSTNIYGREIRFEHSRDECIIHGLSNTQGPRDSVVG